MNRSIMTALVAILTMGAIACAQERKEQDVLRIATFNNQIGFPDEKNEPAKWPGRLPLVQQMLLAEDTGEPLGLIAIGIVVAER